MSMKLTDFVEKYNGDIGVYQRQFASADDSVDNLLLSETDLDPKTVGSSGSNHNINNNNIKDEEKTVVVEKISSPRKRHSNEENEESSDTLAPLPKTVANKQTLAASKFETPAAAAAAKGGAASSSAGSASTSTSVFETPVAATGRAPLVACTPSNTRPPRRSELENPNLTSKLVLYQESKSGSPLAQDLTEMGTPELKKIQAQIDRMMKTKSKQK